MENVLVYMEGVVVVVYIVSNLSGTFVYDNLNIITFKTLKLFTWFWTLSFNSLQRQLTGWFITLSLYFLQFKISVTQSKWGHLKQVVQILRTFLFIEGRSSQCFLQAVMLLGNFFLIYLAPVAWEEARADSREAEEAN